MDDADSRRAWLRRLEELGELDVLVVGALHEDIVRLWTPSVTDNCEVVLTGKQRTHYLSRHPEMAEVEAWLVETVWFPDVVHRNRYDTAMAILYKRVNETRYVRVAVLMQMQSSPRRHSILSYRLAGEREIERNKVRQVWPAT